MRFRLGTPQKSRSDHSRACTERERGGYTSSITNAACCDNRQIDMVRQTR
jgi:hypothetical protein